MSHKDRENPSPIPVPRDPPLRGKDSSDDTAALIILVGFISLLTLIAALVMQC